MGIPFSLLGSIGGNTIVSQTTDQIYDRFFRDKAIKDFPGFHSAFIDFCIFLNEIMPGKSFTVPTVEDIQTFYKEWKTAEEKKEKLIKFVTEKVTVSETDSNVLMVSGMVLPAAAVILKNNAENIQQVKRFKLHLVPNFVFVPGITFLGLTVVRLMQISKKTKS